MSTVKKTATAKRRTSGRRRKDSRRKMKKGTLSLREIALGLVSLCCLIALSVFIGWLRDNRLSNFRGRAEVYVLQQTTPEDVISQIRRQTSIKSERRLKDVFRSMEVEKYIKQGHYTVSEHYSSVYVARMLNNGWESPVKLRLSGTMRRPADIASRISSQTNLSREDIIAAFNDREFLARYGLTPQTAMSIFLPDTYDVWWNMSVRDLFSRFNKAYIAFWTQEREEKAKSLGLDKQQVIILASIVASETNYVPEMPSIAAVYHRRLKKGMKLQADPTVAFIFDYKPDRILNRHVTVESPYNTYRHTGLPPGPICVPSKEAVDAVLNLDRDAKWLYFCASPKFNGTHVFAETFSRHAANAAAYRAALEERNNSRQQ